MIRSVVIFCLMVVLISTAVSCHSPQSRQQEITSYQQAQHDHKFHTRFIATKSMAQALSDKLYRVDIGKAKNPQILSGYLDGSSFAESEPTVTFLRTLYLYTDAKEARLLHLLGQSADFHSSISQPQSQEGFVLFCWVDNELDAVPHAYVYLPKSGELGRGKEWCYVPAAFRVWMSRLIKSEGNPEPKAIHPAT